MARVTKLIKGSPRPTTSPVSKRKTKGGPGVNKLKLKKGAKTTAGDDTNYRKTSVTKIHLASMKKSRRIRYNKGTCTNMNCSYEHRCLRLALVVRKRKRTRPRASASTTVARYSPGSCSCGCWHAFKYWCAATGTTRSGTARPVLVGSLVGLGLKPCTAQAAGRGPAVEEGRRGAPAISGNSSLER